MRFLLRANRKRIASWCYDGAIRIDRRENDRAAAKKQKINININIKLVSSSIFFLDARACLEANTERCGGGTGERRLEGFLPDLAKRQIWQVRCRVLVRVGSPLRVSHARRIVDLQGRIHNSVSVHSCVPWTK